MKVIVATISCPKKCEDLWDSQIIFQPTFWRKTVIADGEIESHEDCNLSHLFVMNFGDTSPSEARFLHEWNLWCKQNVFYRLFQIHWQNSRVHFIVLTLGLYEFDTDKLVFLKVRCTEAWKVAVLPARHVVLMVRCLSMTLRIYSSVHYVQNVGGQHPHRIPRNVRVFRSYGSGERKVLWCGSLRLDLSPASSNNICSISVSIS